MSVLVLLVHGRHGCALSAIEDSAESQDLQATESQELQRRATKKTKSHEAELGDSPKDQRACLL